MGNDNLQPEPSKDIQADWINYRSEKLTEFLASAESYYSRISKFLEWGTTLTIAEITIVGFYLQQTLSNSPGFQLLSTLWGKILIISIICLGFSILLSIHVYYNVISYYLNEFQRKYDYLIQTHEIIQTHKFKITDKLIESWKNDLKRINKEVYLPNRQKMFFLLAYIFLFAGTEFFIFAILIRYL